MEVLKLAATEDLPCVLFDYDKGIFEISQRSLPENAILFYDPLVDSISQYLRSPNEETNVVFHFDYISTSSTKQIMKIILLFDQLSKTKKVNLRSKVS